MQVNHRTRTRREHGEFWSQRVGGTNIRDTGTGAITVEE